MQTSRLQRTSAACGLHFAGGKVHPADMTKLPENVLEDEAEDVDPAHLPAVLEGLS